LSLNVELASPKTAERTSKPLPGTPVLVNRPLRSGVDLAHASCYEDDRWDLSPAVFEEHMSACSLNFSNCSAQYRDTAKTFVWCLLNYDRSVPMRRGQLGRLAVVTLSRMGYRLFPFFDFLARRRVRRLADVTAEDYDAYLAAVLESEVSQKKKECLLGEVRRLWTYREILPAGDALRDNPPWDGDESADLVGRRQHGENATPRIGEDVMRTLLLWSLRYVEDFAPDILTAFDEHKVLARGNWGRRKTGAGRARRPGELTALLHEWVERQRQRGEGLPGKLSPDGTLTLDVPHMTRLFDCGNGSFAIGTRNRAYLDASGLPLENGHRLEAPVTAVLDGRPWLSERIRYSEIGAHARRLSTACFIVVAYLSGMRPGEVLSTERGCVSYNSVTQMWLLTGVTWKSVKDADGNKIPGGKERSEPWVVAEPVARAVAVLERLHDSPLLFPTVFDDKSRQVTTHRGRGRLSHYINKDMREFVTAINVYCALNGREDAIPPDPTERNLSSARFRRTLAWYICRRPRGLVAGAIQYGHLRTQMTLGYAGNYASGFRDLTAVEEFLLRLDELAEDAEQLERGEHVSGPAADAYRHRVREARDRFAGRVLQSGQQVRAITANPALQVSPGRGVTCVFNSRTAACELPPAGSASARPTPTPDDWRPRCANIARTDRDIDELRVDIDRLTRVVVDPLAPPMRHRREESTLRELTAIVEAHDSSRPTTAGES
jgi:integrase